MWEKTLRGPLASGSILSDDKAIFLIYDYVRKKGGHNGKCAVIYLLRCVWR